MISSQGILTPKQRHRRQLVMLLAISAYLLSYFHRIAPAAIAHDLAATFHTSAASLGLLAAIYFYIYTIMQIPVGMLSDTIGPRIILTLGGIVAGMGSLLFGLAPSFESALIGRALVGLGVSVVFIAMLKLIAVWFEPRRFATITGLAMFLGNSGSILAGTPLAQASQIAGWRGIFITVGLFSLFIGIVSWFLVHDHPITNQTQIITAKPNRKIWSELKKVLNNRTTWPGFFINFGIGGSFFSFSGLWVVPLLTQAYRLPKSSAANHVSLYFIGFAIGALLIGRVSDYAGKRKPFIVFGCLAYTLCTFGWMIGSTFSIMQTYSLCAFMGLFTASFNLTWACAKEVNPPELAGMATSVVNTGMFLGGALLQPLTGWVMDRGWDGTLLNGVRFYSLNNYHHGMVLHFIFAFFGLCATLLIKETYCRNISSTLS